MKHKIPNNFNLKQADFFQCLVVVAIFNETLTLVVDNAEFPVIVGLSSKLIYSLQAIFSKFLRVNVPVWVICFMLLGLVMAVVKGIVLAIRHLLFAETNYRNINFMVVANDYK